MKPAWWRVEGGYYKLMKNSKKAGERFTQFSSHIPGKSLMSS